jgi:hypothetical protein
MPIASIVFIFCSWMFFLELFASLFHFTKTRSGEEVRENKIKGARKV